MSESMAPDFASSLDRGTFTVAGTGSMESAADSITASTKAINYDWSGLNDAISKLSGVGSYFDKVATTGQGLTAGAETRGNQENLGTNDGTMAGIGQAMMRLGQKSAQQAQAVGSAQQNQAMQFEQQAAQARQAVAAAQLSKMQSEMVIQQQKFQIGQTMTQANQALNLANLQLGNQYNQAVAAASNTQNLDDVNASQHNIQQIMNYLGAALGAGSALTAGWAGMPSTPGSPTPVGQDASSISDTGITNTDNVVG